jgi:hypothetical protein
LGRTQLGVRNQLHNSIEVLEVSIGEVGDIGAMIKVNRFGRERLTGKLIVIGARAAKTPVGSSVGTARRTKIKHMERPVGGVCRESVESHQPSGDQRKYRLDVRHNESGICIWRENKVVEAGPHTCFQAGLKINWQKL